MHHFTELRPDMGLSELSDAASASVDKHGADGDGRGVWYSPADPYGNLSDHQVLGVLNLSRHEEMVAAERANDPGYSIVASSRLRETSDDFAAEGDRALQCLIQRGRTIAFNGNGDAAFSDEAAPRVHTKRRANAAAVALLIAAAAGVVGGLVWLAYAAPWESIAAPLISQILGSGR